MESQSLVMVSLIDEINVVASVKDVVAVVVVVVVVVIEEAGT